MIILQTVLSTCPVCHEDVRGMTVFHAAGLLVWVPSCGHELAHTDYNVQLTSVGNHPILVFGKKLLEELRAR